MPQARDQAGNIWEVDAQGNPVRLIQPAQQQTRPIAPPDPSKEFAPKQAQADIANTESTISDRNEDNRRDNLRLDADLRVKGLRIGATGQIEEIPNWQPREGDKPATVLEREAQKDGKRQKAQVVASIMSEVMRLYKEDIEGQPVSRGFGAFEKIGDAIGTPKMERFTTTARGMLSLIRPMVAMGAKDGDSDKEMLVFEAYIPNAGDNDITIEGKLRNLERLLSGVAEGALPSQVNLSSTSETPFVDQGLGRDRDGNSVAAAPSSGGGGSGGGSAPTPTPDGQGGVRFSPANGPRLGSDGSETYSTPDDLAVRDAVQAVYNRGGSLQELIAVSEKFGRPVDLQRAQEWSRALDYRDQKGEYAGQNTGFATIPAPESGRRSAMGQMFGDFARSDLGGAVVGFGIGAGNAVTLGGLDEIAGGVSALATGGDAGRAIDYANLTKQGAFDAAPLSSMAGEFAGGMLLGGGAARGFPAAAQILAGSGRRAAATGATVGGVTGALENNNDRLGGALIGSAVGAGGGVLGQKVLAPAAEAAIASRPGQAAERGFRGAMAALRPGFPGSALPQIDENVMRLSRSLGGDVDQVAAQVREARAMGMPYALADATPSLRSMAGSVSRLSQDARQLAENTFDPRALDQAARARTAVSENLTPILDDPAARARELTDAGRAAAQPYYNLAFGKPAPVSPELAAFLNTETGKKALKDARRIAENEGRDPNELGFILDANDDVSIVGMDGRYSRVPVGNPDDFLTRGTVRGMNGDVPVKGPIDMVGWLRLQGGLRESGGELRAMGFTNRARTNMDFVGQEAKFGPLVDDTGMNLDDAAQAAWEAGYFPELLDRPDINTFLNALRETYDGAGSRRFVMDDIPEVERYKFAVEQRNAAQQGRFEGAPLYNDNSMDAGPRPFAPLDAYGKEAKLPTMETLDYVKRAIDGQIYAPGNINPNTGQLISPLPPMVRSLEKFRKDFVGELDNLNPDYPNARKAYQPYVQAREALTRGQSAVSNRAQSRDVLAATAGMPDIALDQYRSGFATGLGDMIDNQNLAGNPYSRIYGSTTMRDKVGALFPEGQARFGRVFDLERDMAATRQETLGGSPTAARMAADQQFGSRAMELAANGVADFTTTSGAMTAGTLARMAGSGVRDAARLGIGRQAEARANRLAPILFDTTGDVDYLDALAAYNRQRAGRQAVMRPFGGLFGATVPAAFIAPE
jgi:hypothetical protein